MISLASSVEIFKMFPNRSSKLPLYRKMQFSTVNSFSLRPFDAKKMFFGQTLNSINHFKKMGVYFQPLQLKKTVVGSQH